jgi:hypothetical protein
VPSGRLAPGLTQGLGVPAAPEAESEWSRSPDEVRDLLSTYRRGLDRGRSAASDTVDRTWTEDDDVANSDGNDDAMGR